MKRWYASYDLDGSFEIKFTDEVWVPTSHKLGPFDTFSEAKKQVIEAFNFCIDELKSASEEVKWLKKKDLSHD